MKTGLWAVVRFCHIVLWNQGKKKKSIIQKRRSSPVKSTTTMKMDGGGVPTTTTGGDPITITPATVIPSDPTTPEKSQKFSDWSRKYIIAN